MQYIHNPVRHRQSGTTMQKTVPAHEVARRASVRRVYKGFPAKPFDNEDDIKAWVSGDTICCLVCGRHLQSLGGHLRIHDLDKTQFREMFNIPWRYALEVESVRREKRERGLSPVNRERIRRIGKTMRTTGYRPACPLGRKTTLEAAVRANKEKPIPKGNDGRFMALSLSAQNALDSGGKS